MKHKQQKTNTAPGADPGRKDNIMYKKWSPSKAAKKEFASKMQEIDSFCKAHGISQSLSGDSFYFTINGLKYRVSNHTIESSDRHMFDDITGEQVRDSYHSEDFPDVCIFAGKTRIIDIYNDISAGYELDGRGKRK